MTQGKIERYHRSMKNVVKLEHYYFPWELENAIAEWVAHYNHQRYHESFWRKYTMYPVESKKFYTVSAMVLGVSQTGREFA